MSIDSRVDAYIAKQADFARPILIELRARLHAAVPGLEETIKWGMPFFVRHGRPFANMAAFKAHASFGFWQRPDQPTGKEGEAMGQFGKLTALADLPDPASFAATVAAAVALVDDGAGEPVRPARPPKPAPVVPPELAAVLAADPVAANHFAGFAPSCRREYCDWISAAKRPETRDKRAAEAAIWLHEGKRRHWKHEAC
ncbi:MAG: hypothetical protein B7Y43_11120 [Sphingomonas sp. 28-62-20]|uniref:YdeI/OmpD-associated family protein n=1 Tax=Sphingomonas sp. 28-62-20 TaxID=1970433 RepID=UPI000BD14816|nr:MAG: hypothetical protein B7Y43_11120 [Sphingomonas sp. 28-62-20]